ncbi:hypothetical protein ACQ4PT_046430 [Festuca glaucescens]
MESTGSRGAVQRSAPSQSSMLYHLTNSAWLYLALGVLRSFFNHHLRRPLRRFLPSLDPFVTVDVAAKPEDHSYYYGPEGCAKSSDAYGEVLAYLSVACSREARELRAEGAAEGHGLVLSLREGQLVVDEYLPYVRRTGQELASRNRPRRIYSNKKELNYQYEVETLAMDPAKKQMIMDDLDDFRNSRDYYRRIGKAWKRGYLLYGPPGTGKSTMIAAMANYLNYDIYDIELTSLQTNGDLRKLFVETTGKSIIVIEDIDCSLDLTGSRASMMPQRDVVEKSHDRMVTLYGLLNFLDGLWSAHSGERIIVITTNRPQMLDPALIRPGRMDMHVEMSYCKFGAFMTLAKNYLGVDAHPLFYDVEELLQVADMTPADVAECLMMPSERTARCGVDACLARLVDELKKKREEKRAAQRKLHQSRGRARRIKQKRRGSHGGRKT